MGRSALLRRRNAVRVLALGLIVMGIHEIHGPGSSGRACEPGG